MSSSSSVRLVLLSLVVALAGAAPSSSSQCPVDHKLNGVTKRFTTCRALQVQGAALSWTYLASNKTLSLAFTSTAASASGWVGWGINLTPTPGMIGSDALIAFSAADSNSSRSSAHVESYALTRESLGHLTPGPLSSVKLLDKAVEIQGSRMTIFATIQLPNNLSSTTVNHIWNRGPGVAAGLSPLPHSSSDSRSIGRIDIATGSLVESSPPHQQLKNRHGIINAVGWGILFPIGVMSARYLRSFPSADPAWFYIHAVCQSSGYVLGVVGWATGLRLGGYATQGFHTHRNLGISIFVFATLQILSLLLRPKKDHPVRKYWNVYHHSIGYATIAMIIANIFEGFDLLRPERKWKHVYIGVIASLGGISLLLEVITWMLFFRRKSKASTKGMNGSSLGLPHGQTANGWNGTA